MCEFFEGQIYNSKEMREELEKQGIIFDGNSNEELLVKAYSYYGYNIIKYLNGVFAFVIRDDKTEELFLARDHFGVKPLYYTIIDNNLVFASEIKTILKYPGFEAVIDKEGICELFGIGPAHTARNMCI